MAPSLSHLSRAALLTTASLTLATAAFAADHGHDHNEENAGTSVSSYSAAGAAASLAAKPMGAWGFDLTGRDPSIKPGQDFFSAMNGQWVRTTEIPADRGSQGAFAMLRDLSEARVRSIIEGLASAPQTDPDAKKIADYYTSFMDEAAVEKAGIAPIATDLAALRAVASKDDLVKFAQTTGIGIGFGFGASPDTRDPTINRLSVSQGGLGLGDRDLYVLDDNNNPKVRAAYLQMLTDYFKLAGQADPAKAAATVFDYEKSLAIDYWTRTENRDPIKRENPRTIAALESEAVGFPWQLSFASAGVDLAAVKDLNLSQPSAAKAFAKTWSETPLETLKLYAEARLLSGVAGLLSKDWQDAQFRFAKVRSGQTEQRPRWKRAVDATEAALGEAIGKRYVAQYFPPSSKAQMLVLVQNLRSAYAERIKSLDWMSAETKTRALKKLERQNVKIGYPDKWKDYSSLVVVKGDIVGNAKRAGLWDRADNLQRIGKPVDKGEWGMTPQTVNAYFSPLNNEIVFPAAILQPPFFDPKADPAINYGGIGGVIGHEISHGFDDQGRNYDFDGSLRDWWQPGDAAEFKKRADVLAAQYSSYEPLPGMKLNGRVSLGENIGDLGGLAIAYEAYKMSQKGKKAPILNGTTGDQRVFMGWAQVWRIKYREEALRATATASPHSPGMYRVNGIVRNLDAWYKAFDVKLGDALYLTPEQRVRIW